MSRAQNTNRRWSRAMQHEHSKRLQLQENMEKLATEMHSLETEARRSFSKGHWGPALANCSTESSREKEEENAEAVMMAVGELKGDRVEEESEDDDKFFDAVEVSNNEWIGSKSVSFKPMGVEVMGEVERETEEDQKFSHRRNVSTVSMNEAQMLLSSPEPDQLPVCPERTMSVNSWEKDCFSYSTCIRERLSPKI